MKTPVLLIAFNRPIQCRRVIDEICKARPSRVYFSVDGPRKSMQGEESKVAEVRELAKHLDNHCEVQTRFSDENQGCRYGPFNAIQWFFEHEPEGIILEDDCLPAPAFFRFAEAMIGRYRNDNRVMHIGGNTFGIDLPSSSAGYRFINHAQVWGWATWRRAWQLMDIDARTAQEFVDSGGLNSLALSRGQTQALLKRLESIADGIDAWDFQWQYTVYSNRGLCIIPTTNLVTNVGWGKDAIHTFKYDKKRHALPTGEIDLPIRDPNFVLVDSQADKFFARMLYGPRSTWARQLGRIWLHLGKLITLCTHR